MQRLRREHGSVVPGEREGAPAGDRASVGSEGIWVAGSAIAEERREPGTGWSEGGIARTGRPTKRAHRRVVEGQGEDYGGEGLIFPSWRAQPRAADPWHGGAVIAAFL